MKRLGFCLFLLACCVAGFVGAMKLYPNPRVEPKPAITVDQQHRAAHKIAFKDGPLRRRHQPCLSRRQRSPDDHSL